MAPEGFRERLRRLRREAAPPVAPGEAALEEGARAGADEAAASAPPEQAPRAAARAGLPDWLRRRLRPGGEPAPRPAPGTPGLPEGLAPFECDGLCGLARLSRFPLDARHGDFALAEARDARAESFALLTGDGALAQLDPGRALYLDTETTGLSGGAGTYVFLVGLGRFTAGAFEVWQGFLAGPESERALLAEVARRTRESAGVVSFFGKSFDRHRLEDKMRMAGVEPPFAERAHLDLYHPCQRIARGSLADGRLRTLEAAFCGVEREDDLPGAFAPAAWFDYLAGRPHRLEGVFRHNLDDVLSLVTLAAHLGRAVEERRVSGQPLAGCGRARAKGLARSFLAAGEHGRALDWLAEAIARERRAGLEPRELLAERADLLRRARRPAEARAAYEELLAAPPDRHSAPALLGLSMLHEHAFANPAAAHEAAARAAELLPRFHDGAERARLAADLARRQSRLAARLARGRGRLEEDR